MARMHLVLILCLAALAGCSAAPACAERTLEASDRLWINIVAVDLKDNRIVCGPEIWAVPAHVGDAWGVGGTFSVSDWSHPLPLLVYEFSYSVSRVRQDAVRVEATLDQRGTKSSASGELKLEKGAWRILFLPTEENRRCMFLFACLEMIP